VQSTSLKLRLVGEINLLLMSSRLDALISFKALCTFFDRINSVSRSAAKKELIAKYLDV